MPWLLNSGDVFWLGYWWTKAIWHPKVLDVTMVAFEWMLLGRWEPICTHTAYPKYFMVVVESFEGSVKGIERVFCEDVLVCNITEVEKYVECFDDIWWNITLECIHEDLLGWVYWGGEIGQISTFMKAFELFLVHCLKLWPCLNLCRPGKSGTSTILLKLKIYLIILKFNTPLINLIKNSLSPWWPMHFLKVVFNPLDKVVFECPLDSLMKEVTGEEFVNIHCHTWEWPLVKSERNPLISRRSG